MDLLRVEGLQVRYPIHREPSIKDVSFTMKKGELVLLTGKSGCGKSTLLKCINLTIPHFIQAEMRGVICIGDRKYSIDAGAGHCKPCGDYVAGCGGSNSQLKG
jgi:energy-coupling factor transporter ATP-binding protein EcfA2